jgi:hypothetical protein
MLSMISNVALPFLTVCQLHDRVHTSVYAVLCFYQSPVCMQDTQRLIFQIVQGLMRHSQNRMDTLLTTSTIKQKKLVHPFITNGI